MKFKTGIAGLDEFLQGGLPPRVILLLGAPGSGSEVFARQVAYSRATQSGVTYFLAAKPPETVKDDMSTYGWDVAALEEKGSWRFLNLNKAGSLTDTVTREMKDGRCLVIDSLSELLLTSKVEEGVQILNSMAIQNRECKGLHIILLTGGMQDSKVETTIQHFAEGIIVFTTRWEAAETSRSLLIKKMLGGFAPSRRLPYSIGERGFTVETAIRIT